MDRVERALKLYGEGLSCSQAVAGVFADKFDMNEETMRKIAGGFGGGIGSSGLICGALSGAIMVLGLKYSAVTGEDQVTKDKMREQVRALMDKFKEKFGSTDCREILGYDMRKEEDFKYVHENNITRKVCPVFLEFAVKELEKVL